jgi:hypothetical protein
LRPKFASLAWSSGTSPLARGKPRNAHVIAADGATCLVLMPRQPTLFEARGEGAALAVRETLAGCTTVDEAIAVRLSIEEGLDKKLQALAAYRSQLPIRPDMLPESVFFDLFGVEYFLPVPEGRQPAT